MARPKTNTVAYFPHDAHAAEGDTLTILQGKWGNDGYAFWFRLLEKLCLTEGHFIDCSNPVKWQLLLAKTRLTNGTGEEIMNTLVELEAIDPELWQAKRIIWCQNLVNNITDAYRNRKRPMPEKPVYTPKNLITTPDNPQMKRNETILNKNKKEKAASPEKKQLEFDEYVEELRPQYADLNFDKELKRFHLYWSEGGRKLKRPKSALTNWMEKARDFKQEKSNGAHRGNTERSHKTTDEERRASLAPKFRA